MDWTIETTRGGFEGTRLKQVIKDMIEHYGSNDEEPNQIEYIVGYSKNGREKMLCEKAISRIQDYIEEEVAEWRRIADEEHRGQKDIESDYYQNLL